MGLLGWAVVFFIIALIAAAPGFTGIAVAATEIARTLFAVFPIVFLVLLAAGLTRRPRI